MNKTKNKKLAIFSTGLAIFGAVTFVSCSQESDYLFGTDLGIDSQVPMTRSAAPETPQYRDNENNNRRKTPVYDDECGLYALTEVKKCDPHAFTVEFDDKTASDYYYSLKKCAADSCGYQGGAMTASEMLVVGKKYNLLTGMCMFGGNTRPADYFADNANRNKAKIVCFQKNGRDHYAKINGININGGVIKYIDSDGSGSISMDQIQGVMYK